MDFPRFLDQPFEGPRPVSEVFSGRLRGSDLLWASAMAATQCHTVDGCWFTTRLARIYGRYAYVDVSISTTDTWVGPSCRISIG